MKYLLNGGPGNGEEMDLVEPYPWIKFMVNAHPIPTYEEFAASAPPTPHLIPIANYRRVRYTDGRIGYEYAGMDSGMDS